MAGSFLSALYNDRAIPIATGPSHTLSISGQMPSPSASRLPHANPSSCNRKTALSNKQISFLSFSGRKTLDGNLKDKIQTGPVSVEPPPALLSSHTSAPPSRAPLLRQHRRHWALPYPLHSPHPTRELQPVNSSTTPDPHARRAWSLSLGTGSRASEFLANSYLPFRSQLTWSLFPSFTHQTGTNTQCWQSHEEKGIFLFSW